MSYPILVEYLAKALYLDTDSPSYENSKSANSLILKSHE